MTIEKNEFTSCDTWSIHFSIYFRIYRIHIEITVNFV